MLADVVVMPSVTPEPFGRVALEAQAMGRPLWQLPLSQLSMK